MLQLRKVNGNMKNVGRRKRLPPVAVRLRLSIGLNVFEVDGARNLPNGLAGLLVERGDVLFVAAVEG